MAVEVGTFFLGAFVALVLIALSGAWKPRGEGIPGSVPQGPIADDP
jgi:hypothetical protein